MAKHTHAIGVDFGTTTSLVAERQGLAPTAVVPIGRTTSWLPSLAAEAAGDLLIGEDADSIPGDLQIRSVKSAITNHSKSVRVKKTGHELDADDVIRSILGEIVTRAARNGQNLGAGADVRLGCPAMWSGEQRARLLRLAGEAGMAVDDAALIDEPIAAGVAWVAHRYLRFGERKRGRLLVFDMGGGTLDIAVLDVVGGERPEMSVLSALGIDQAGDSLDQTIARDVMQDLEANGVMIGRLEEPDLAEALLLRSVRRTKFALSTEYTSAIRLDPPYHRLPAVEYSRERLENAFEPQLRTADACVLAALRQARLTQAQHADPAGLRRLTRADLAADIKFVLLAGGMSRVPAIERRLGAMFPDAEVHHDAGVAVEEIIVAGLSDTTAYERINLHRPGFDFVLQWTDRAGDEHENVLYSAHSPFYSMADAFAKTELAYRAAVSVRELPQTGAGQLRARSVTGEWLRLALDGRECDGIAIPFGHRDVVLKMHTNGRLRLVDGRGQAVQARVATWPVIRGRDHQLLALTRDPSVDRPAPPMPWYLDKEYVPGPLPDHIRSRKVRTANW